MEVPVGNSFLQEDTRLWKVFKASFERPFVFIFVHFSLLSISQGAGILTVCTWIWSTPFLLLLLCVLGRLTSRKLDYLLGKAGDSGGLSSIQPPSSHTRIQPNRQSLEADACTWSRTTVLSIIFRFEQQVSCMVGGMTWTRSTCHLYPEVDMLSLRKSVKDILPIHQIRIHLLLIRQGMLIISNLKAVVFLGLKDSRTRYIQ
ncbi:hypothetical protein K435DRAFT_91645 [Dendrothele bispora CBS 962.96]|uniref:Uncharacterized protein n=1 Tax=Dendrothele bispora (strain CBS 962.96) TaxID=1314807 RepID=A0A4S8MT37_DENBC|nr:hypothetical protein K435DRAFT_91645 [Dendrothele bispora CBS 962.96]